MWIPFLSGIRGRGRAEPRGGPRERGGQFAAPWCWVLVRGFVRGTQTWDGRAAAAAPSG